MKSNFYIKAFEIILIIVIMLSVASCNRRKFRTVTSFNLKENILQVGDTVKIIGFTKENDFGENDKFYNQYIVVKNSTQDTANVLVPCDHAFESKDLEKYVIFFPESSIAYRITQLTQNAMENISNITEIPKAKRYDKVIRVPKYDSISYNNYPTTFGVFGFDTLEVKNIPEVYKKFKN